MKKAKTWFEEFKNFAVKGDAFSLAIGVIVGAAFKGVIDSLVNDIVMPPISYLTSKVDFTNMFVTLGGKSYETLEQAKEAGAIVITYGNLINQLIIFLITAVTLFLFIYKFQQMIAKQDEEDKQKPKTTKKCEFCLNEIPIKATKCGFCTSKVK